MVTNPTATVVDDATHTPGVLVTGYLNQMHTIGSMLCMISTERVLFSGATDHHQTVGEPLVAIEDLVTEIVDEHVGETELFLHAFTEAFPVIALRSPVGEDELVWVTLCTAPDPVVVLNRVGPSEPGGHSNSTYIGLGLLRR